MPEPKSLRIGDMIKFTSRPKEWNSDGANIDKWDLEFIDAIIKRGRWQRISAIDEYGNRWFNAILTRNGHRELHSWAVMEKTGWIKK